jgi:hypothetical protein
MWVQCTYLRVLFAAGYLLAVSAAGLFHNHADHGEGPSDSKTPPPCIGEEHGCAVCDFLAQKPAPVVAVSPEPLAAVVQEVAAPVPVRSEVVVFAAWNSRAPPSPA